MFRHPGVAARFQRISWMTEFLNTETHTVVLLMNYLQSPRLREVRIGVNTVLKLTSLKTEIARSVRGRAEDALAEPYLVQKILVIRLQQITKFSAKVVNLETIIDMQSWCRTWPPSHFVPRSLRNFAFAFEK